MNRVFRVPPVDLASILASDPNPQVDLKLSAYENSTRNFLKAVSNYTNRAITEITNRRNAQAAERQRIAEKVQSMENEIDQCKLREIELITTLEREQNEKKEVELSVAAFKRQLASLRDQCASIDVEIEQYGATTSNLRHEKEKERSMFKTHASQVSLELEGCQQQLQCMVEGIEKDTLLIRFTHVDRADLDREFHFVLDISSPSYKVVTSTPLLPTLPILVDELNESRDAYGFIKKVRHAFEDLTVHNQ